MLQQVATADADIAALTARAYLRLRRPDDARRHLDLALKEYSLTPGACSPERHRKRYRFRTRRLPDGSASDLHSNFTANWRSEHPPTHCESGLENQRSRIPPRIVSRDGRIVFTFPAPQVAGPHILHVCCGGIALLGSGRRLPLEFSLDGRAESVGERIEGWARVGWLPTQPVQLRFEDEHGHCPSVENKRHRSPRASLAVPDGSAKRRRPRQPHTRNGPNARRTLASVAATHRCFLIARSGSEDLKPIRLPRWRKDSSPVKRVRRSSSRRAALIDMLIPVYGGGQETLACIDSVLATITERARVIVVDDATRRRGARCGRSMNSRPPVASRCCAMEKNLGFVHSVNRVLAMRSSHDIVLLNSDTLVFGDWLQRLSSCGVRLIPCGDSDPLQQSTDRSRATPVRPDRRSTPTQRLRCTISPPRTHAGISIEVPVGVGFCMYLRYDCLRDVGELDAAVFGMGYGEEV